MSLRYALATDRGSVREKNEDRARAVPERGLFVVADGMGGHVAGEVASQVAVDSFIDTVLAQPRPRRIRDEIEIVQNAIHTANRAVLQAADEMGLTGMGTTLTALLVRGRTATIAHIGDSRAYFANRKLVRLTRDHTVVSLMVVSGLLDEAAAHRHPDRHVLTQAMGTAEWIEPDVFQTRIPRSSQILLCTDGLHDVVAPDAILKLAHTTDLEASAQELIESAKRAGAPDNITLILIDL